MIGLLSEQIGGQIGGGLSSESSTVRSRTLVEFFETSVEAMVRVASANVKVIKIGFMLISLIPVVPEFLFCTNCNFKREIAGCEGA